MKTALPSLDEVCVNSPCPMKWAELAGDDRTRACEACGKHVHNLSAMTRAEAEQALADPAIECVTFIRGPDGRIVTSDSPKRWWRRTLALMLAWVALVFMLGCGSDDKPKRKTPSGTPIPDGCEYDPATGTIRTLGKR